GLLLLVRLRESDLGAVDVGLDGAHRALDYQVHADGGRRVVDDVCAVHQLGDQWRVDRGLDVVVEPRVGLEMADVLDRSSREVVQDLDLVASLQKLVGQMRADESGPAGDQVAHPFPFNRISRSYPENGWSSSILLAA